MSPQLSDVGPLEMEVLGILETVDGGTPMSVAQVQTVLNRSGKRDLAYTTVMTVLVRLHGKNFVRREKQGRQFFYRFHQQKASPSHRLLQRVKQSLFQHQRLQPILALLDSEQNLTADELKELRQAVDEKIKLKTEKSRT